MGRRESQKEGDGQKQTVKRAREMIEKRDLGSQRYELKREKKKKIHRVRLIEPETERELQTQKGRKGMHSVTGQLSWHHYPQELFGVQREKWSLQSQMHKSTEGNTRESTQTCSASSLSLVGNSRGRGSLMQVTSLLHVPVLSHLSQAQAWQWMVGHTW